MRERTPKGMLISVVGNTIKCNLLPHWWVGCYGRNSQLIAETEPKGDKNQKNKNNL